MMAEKMVVFTKRLNNKNSKRIEKKILNNISWGNPLIEVSEEVEIMLQGEDEELTASIEKLREVAEENEYEMEVIE